MRVVHSGNRSWQTSTSSSIIWRISTNSLDPGLGEIFISWNISDFEIFLGGGRLSLCWLPSRLAQTETPRQGPDWFTRGLRFRCWMDQSDPSSFFYVKRLCVLRSFPRQVKAALSISAPIKIKPEFPEFYDGIHKELKRYNEHCEWNVQRGLNETFDLSQHVSGRKKCIFFIT